MKKNIVLMTIMALGSFNLLAQVQSSEIVKGPLWTAPIAKKQTFKISSLNESRLKKVCQRF
ncbi:MAG: hypothetical protein Fur0010_04510 [Bdellovibrio sp.]